MNTSMTATARRNVEAQKNSLRDKVAHLRSIDRCLTISSIATFMIYFAFIMSLYISSLWALNDAYSSYASSIPALIFFTIFALFLSFVLASVKHIGYRHATWFKLSPFAIVMFISFGIGADWFTTADTQNTKAQMTAENSAEAKKILGTGDAASTGKIEVPLAKEVAAAEKTYNQCVEKLKEKKVKHCRGDYANWKSLEKSQKLSMEMTASTSIKSKELDNNRLDKLKHEAHNPLIVALSSSASITIATAIATLTFWVALVFEVLHFFLSVFRRQTAELIEGVKEGLKKAEAEYIETESNAKRALYATPKTDPTEDTNDGFAARQKQRLADAQKSHNTPALTPATAEHSDDNESEKPAKQGFGFIPETPRTAERNNEISNRSEPQYPSNQSRSGTGLASPKLGTNEAHYELPIPQSVPLDENRTDPRTYAAVRGTDTGGTEVENKGTETPKSDRTGTAEEQIANPNNFALLQRYVVNPKFDLAFVSLATGETKCSQKQAMKNFKIGSDLAYWLMIILEAWEIVSPPASNRQRRLFESLSEADAKQELKDVKFEILSKEP